MSKPNNLLSSRLSRPANKRLIIWLIAGALGLVVAALPILFGLDWRQLLYSGPVGSVISLLVKKAMHRKPRSDRSPSGDPVVNVALVASDSIEPLGVLAAIGCTGHNTVADNPKDNVIKLNRNGFFMGAPKSTWIRGASIYVTADSVACTCDIKRSRNGTLYIRLPYSRQALNKMLYDDGYEGHVEPGIRQVGG